VNLTGMTLHAVESHSVWDKSTMPSNACAPSATTTKTRETVSNGGNLAHCARDGGL